MASSLASIFGSEKDKVNCSFYYKIGACRHGDRCSRKHIKPLYSQTVLLANMYQSPAHNPENTMTEEQIQQHFDDFFEDVFTEVATKYGEVEEMHVCDNVGDHLIGNVYMRFRYEEDAQKCVDALNNRFYNGRPIHADLSPVTDFREACCRQFEQNECTRGGLCNFMHLKTLSKRVKKDLYQAQREMLQKNPDPRGRALSRTPEDARSYSPGAHVRDRRGRGGGGGGGGGGDDYGRSGGGGGGGGYGRSHDPYERDRGRDYERDRRDRDHRDSNRDRDRDRDFRDRDRGRDREHREYDHRSRPPMDAYGGGQQQYPPVSQQYEYS